MLFMWGITIMKINYKLNENSTIRSYAISYDGTGLDIGDYEIKIGCDKIINGNLVKCSDEEYKAFIETQNSKRKQYEYEDYVNSLIRQKYSLSQELAILRQKTEKPTEYTEYFNYCEQCKNIGKQKYNI